MSKIEQNKEIKRKRILASAQEAFLTDGYAMASMDKIAAHGEMTKQTLYRYFSSKEVLFRATLLHLGKDLDESFTEHLNQDDTRLALISFATAFISFHVSEEHISIYRLLITESVKTSEIIDIFMSVRNNDEDIKLTEFFSKRLNVVNADSAINLWQSTLLSLRGGVLIGQKKPSLAKIKHHAIETTEYLLKAIG
jgi:AcrR family transcriptional regulator